MSDKPNIDLPDITRNGEKKLLLLVAATFVTWSAACIAAGYFFGSM